MSRRVNEAECIPEKRFKGYLQPGLLVESLEHSKDVQERWEPSGDPDHRDWSTQSATC
jgi:hypothetical protein